MSKKQAPSCSDSKNGRMINSHGGRSRYVYTDEDREYDAYHYVQDRCDSCIRFAENMGYLAEEYTLSCWTLFATHNQAVFKKLIALAPESYLREQLISLIAVVRTRHNLDKDLLCFVSTTDETLEPNLDYPEELVSHIPRDSIAPCFELLLERLYYWERMPCFYPLPEDPFAQDPALNWLALPVRRIWGSVCLKSAAWVSYVNREENERWNTVLSCYGLPEESKSDQVAAAVAFDSIVNNDRSMHRPALFLYYHLWLETGSHEDCRYRSKYECSRNDDVHVEKECYLVKAVTPLNLSKVNLKKLKETVEKCELPTEDEKGRGFKEKKLISMIQSIANYAGIYSAFFTE